MSLRESISRSLARAFQRLEKQQQQKATTSGVIDARTMDAFARDWGANFGLELDRLSRYNDFDQMDVGDVAVMLDHIAAQALQFEEAIDTNTDPLQVADCFKVEFTGKNKEGRKVLADTVEATRIRQLMPEIARDMVKYGDEFDELIWDGDDIVGCQPHKVRDMYANTDRRGRLFLTRDEQGKPVAYQQRREDGQAVAGWFPYEMLHFKLYPSAKERYSRRGLLDIIRWDWKKLNWMEQGMVLARTTRAYPRLIWQRDMTGKTTLDAGNAMHDFIMAITRKRSAAGDQQKAPMTPEEDYFVASGYQPDVTGKLYPKLDDIKLLDPNLAGLGSILDVQYQRRKLFNVVPSSVVGIFDSAQSDMTPQDIALARFVDQVQRSLELGLRTLFDRALIAKGIDPKSVGYRIIWPRTTIHTDWRYADGRFRNSMADSNYMANGIISRRTIRMREFGMTDEESSEEETQIEKELKTLATMYPTNSGQGEGEGSGSLGPAGAPAVQAGANSPDAAQPLTTPPQATQQAKSRAAGQNNRPSPKNLRAKAQKEALAALRRVHQEQLGLISMLTPIAPTGDN